jgi:hypothetical protein
MFSNKKHQQLAYLTLCCSVLFVVIFGCNRDRKIPELHLFAPTIEWEEKQPCTLKIQQTNTESVWDGEIKFRGGMSSKYDKHSYALKLTEKVALGGLPASKHWVLNAAYSDKTFQRNALSYALFRQMREENYAPKTAYVELYENGKYKGLYVLTERVDKRTLALSKNDKKAFLFKEPPLFYPDKTDENRDSLYLVAQKFPKPEKRNCSSDLQYLEHLINRADDQQFKQEIFQLLDIQSIIDWQLILLLSNNGDGQWKNYFMYKKNKQTPLRIALWDYDHTFGRDGDNESNFFERLLDEKRLVLFQRLMRLNAGNFNDKLAERWWELRKNVFTVENIYKLIAQNDQILRPYISKNAAVWPIDNPWYYDSNDYFQELDRMKNFIRKRLVQLDKRFQTA